MRSAWPVAILEKESKSGETREFEKRKASILIKMANLGVKINHFYDPTEHRECSAREPEKKIHYVLKGKGFSAVDCMWAYTGKILSRFFISFACPCSSLFKNFTREQDF